VNWLLLKNSLVASTLTTFLAMGFGLVAALWVVALPKRWRGFFLGAAVVALVLPPFVVTNCWLHFFGYTGVWRRWLPLDLFTLGGTVWVLGLLLWPITLFATYGAWQRLEPEQLESDTVVTGWWLLRGLLLPLARTALAQSGVLIFVLAINNFAVPSILQVKVAPAEMWIRFNTAFDTAGALQLSWPLVIVPLLLLFWFARRGVPWPHKQSTASAELLRRQLGRSWFLVSGFLTVVICFLSAGLPFLQLMLTGRTWTELPGALAAGQSAFWNSFWFAAASATVIVGIVMSAQARFSNTRGGRSSPVQSVLLSLVWLPFLLPGVLIGIGLIYAFNRPGFMVLYQSAGIVVLAFAIRYLGFGWNLIARAATTMDPDLMDVARLEGASRWQIFRHVQWPQLGGQVVAAWYLVFLLCLWDVESMILVVPPGGETVALRVFNLLHYGHNAQVNALCLTLVALALVPLIGWKATILTLRAFRFPMVKSIRPAVISWVIFLSVPMAVLVAGCTPRSLRNDAALESKVFERVHIISHRGVGVGELNKPRSVSVDRADNLYVTDMTGRVQKFSSNGVFLLSWQMPQTDKGRPKGMCVDREGNIVVNEPHYSRVNHFSPSGQLVAQWGIHGTNDGQLTFPRSVAVNSRNEVYVSEYGLVERVQCFTARGEKFINSFGHAGTGPGEFNRPEGLFIDSHDRVYVADSCNHRIQVFTSDGHFLRAYGKPGRGKGELSYPYDICVDAAGRQYVCEFGNSRVQVFDADDKPIEIIGGPGADPGQFNNPWGIALDSQGNLYVADSQNHRVQKLIAKGAGTKLLAEASNQTTKQHKPAGKFARALTSPIPLTPAALSRREKEENAQSFCEANALLYHPAIPLLFPLQLGFSLPPSFHRPSNESDSRNWKGGPKTRRVGLFIVVAAPPLWFFCFSAARSTMMNSLVPHVRAAEKQKNRIEGDAAHPINRPPLRGFIMLTLGGTYSTLQETWVITSLLGEGKGEGDSDFKTPFLQVTTLE
jgi:ABC-type Fe3+ transport system permease subunit/DNA-binding beta-propeller fold protein YncE